MALDDVLDWLVCPHCGDGLARDGGSVRCRAGHAFDVARQGHLNLLGGPQPANADTAEMVAHRLSFLERGHYLPVAEALGRAVAGATRVVDAGAGPGWYLARLLDADGRRRGLALDVSVPACRRAARAHPRLGAVVADTWRGLPLHDGVADAVTAVFAPRNLAEFARVLAPGGVLVVVSPGPDHLREARAELGLLGVGGDKHERLLSDAAGEFKATGEEAWREVLPLSATEVAEAVGMGPNAFHRHAEPRAMSVTADVRVWRLVRR